MWLNFLSLLPATFLTLLLISIAFLRFYDQTDFTFLGFITDPRAWSNRWTVAAILATLANFGFEWNRRNRETNRLAREESRRVDRERREESRRLEEKQRRVEERERTTRRTRIENRRYIAEIQFSLDPSPRHRQELEALLSLLKEYGDLI